MVLDPPPGQGLGVGIGIVTYPLFVRFVLFHSCSLSGPSPKCPITPDMHHPPTAFPGMPTHTARWCSLRATMEYAVVESRHGRDPDRHCV